MKIVTVLLAILCSLSIRIALCQPKYEFRAAWIATVSNIDWPSPGNFDPESQKAEFILLLDKLRNNGLNAVVVQIRPASDAFYPSQYEPWSEWLTGRQGRPPSPYYDPLQFMIDETHKRGMEFHAWCNPYRAEFSIGRSSISPTHVTRIHPEWFLAYGGKRYFDPGNKDAQLYVTGVIRDIVRRYDIDAIHLDDYFYPYRIAGLQFPDARNFYRYGNGMTLADWRRSNVDSIIHLIGRAIREENRYCKFGVSPFGVWRNKSQDAAGSDTRGGTTNYDDLYADILLWLKKGWIDYVTPQLYWEMHHRLVGFETLAEWWSRFTYGRHLYIGHGVYRVYDQPGASWRNPNELPGQINIVREFPTIQGSVFYSSRPFLRNPNGWNDSLRNNYYRYPAIVPPMPWIDSTRPEPPRIIRPDKGTWNLSAWHESGIRYFIVYQVPENQQVITAPSQVLKIIPAPDGEAVFHEPEANGNGYAVTVVGRNNVESDFVILK
jgi:uncharacterized lipoprotein YddW (UPF0748 family)